MSQTLYIIDGHGQFFRAYHAIRSGITSPVTREPTNMTFGFTGILLKLLRDYKPDYIAVVIDAAGDQETFRSEIYPEYKAHRPPPPEDFRPQVTRCLEVLSDLDIPVIGLPGVEADDVIATLARRFQSEHPDLTIRIISRDKDLTQILRDGVELFDVQNDEFVTPDKLFKTEGVLPSQVVDILSLMGDSVDNVPGVPGIGPKTAAALIQQYGSIDNLLAHLDEIKGKKRENIEAARDTIALSRRLVLLKDDVPFDFDLEAARFDVKNPRIRREELQGLFRTLGFNRFQDDFAALFEGTLAPGETARSNADKMAAMPPAALAPREARSKPAATSDHDTPSLFGSAGDEPLDPPRSANQSVTYEMIADEPHLVRVLAQLRAAGVFALDTETDGLGPVAANLCGVSLAVEPCKGWYIPVRSPTPEAHLDLATVRKHLAPLLGDPSLKIVGHNLKFDLNILRHHGMPIARLHFDTMIASYVIDATRSSHKLDVLALALLEHTCTPLTDLIGVGKHQKTFDTVPLDQATHYAAEDADVALRLYHLMSSQLDALGPAMRDLFHNVEMPLVEVLAALEYNGIRVDPAELDRQRERLITRIADLRRQIIDHSPHPFNPDSPKQLAAALFNKPDQDPPGLGIKPLRRGKTGPSTDQEVLEKLAADQTIASPVPLLIVEYRQLTKLVNTYLVALKEAIQPSTGRVHASFNQTVAATGRLSASDPNLQNIPIRSDIGREIRRAFIADPGNVLVSADYSQIELRILAHLSEDPALIEAFRQGQDIHTAVAAEVFGVKPEDVTPAQRSSAKMVNFGIVYGVTAYGLARRLGPDVSNEYAARIIADYKARFSRIDAFLDACIAKAQRDGYVETMLHRRRAVPQIHARNPQERALGERIAINSVVQGSAADLIKLAMINLHRALPERFPSTRMVLQIHDELVFEAPKADAPAVAALVTKRMQNAMTLNVPLVAEANFAEQWIGAK